MHELSPQKALPVGVILTISAAGSELSNSCVLTNSENWLKRGFNSDLIRPLFAIMNRINFYGFEIPNRLRYRRYHDAHFGTLFYR